MGITTGIWITEEDEEEAAALMEEWEKQGCTYKEVETKIAALSHHLEKCRRKRETEPFKAYRETNVRD